ncbi:hypothetical protein ACOME3_004269 [Neoechinorhynchus agilis]
MKIFCAGLDSRSPLLEKSAITEADIKSEANLLHECWKDLRASLKPKLSIAAVNGKALGAGFELALLCDMIVASPNAQFAFPEITKHGFIPGFGGISQLCARIGSSCNCLDIILSGDIIGSDKAMSIGLINRVIDEVDCTEFQNKSVEFAQRVSNSRDLAVDAAKAIIDRYQQIRSEDYSSVEHDCSEGTRFQIFKRSIFKMLINNIITAYILSEFDFIKIRPWFRRFNDNKWPESWHLHRSGFSIERTWKLGYTGKNVVIGVVDEGIEIDHPELKDSILTLIPYPTLYSKHGTACAGIIAAKPNNMFCTVGIAYNSRLVDFNINAKHRGKLNFNESLEQSFGLSGSLAVYFKRAK